jgi:WD40 repeat protein
MDTHTKFFVSALFAAVLTTYASSMTRADEPAEQPAKITYQEHIQPIFRENCYFCHNQDDAKSDLALDSFGRLTAGGAGGAVLVPGDPEASRLWKLVSHEEAPEMPPEEDKLDDASLELIKNWIAGGALENADSKPNVPERPMVDPTIAASAAGPAGAAVMPEGLSRQTPVFTKRGSGLTAVATSPWAPLVAIAGQQQIVLYHAETGELVGILPFGEGITHVLRFSRNGALLLAGGGHAAKAGQVVVFDVKTGRRVIEVGDELDAVLAADINEDHTLIALGGPSRVVRTYSTADGSLVHEIRKHNDWITSLEFSPDGVLLATGDRSGGLQVWEAENARAYLDLKGHSGAITAVSWRLDSNVLASSSEDGTVRLWATEGGAQNKSWGGHSGGTASVRFNRDGLLTTAGRDKQVKTWDQNGTQIRALEPFDDLALAATFTYDGRRVIGGDWNGDVRMWNAEDGALVAHLRMNPLTLQMVAELAATEAAEAAAAVEKLAVELAAPQKAASDAAATLAAANAQLAAAATAIGPVQAVNDEAAGKLAEAASIATKAADLLAATQAAFDKAEAARIAAAAVATEKAAALAAAQQASAAKKTEAEQLAAAKAAADQALAEKQAAVDAANQTAAAAKAKADQAAAEAAAYEQEQSAQASAAP